MSLTETQQKVLDCICSRGGGVDIHEAMKMTGYNYTTIVQTAYQLISKGYEIRALSVGNMNTLDPRFRGWIKRFYLSPYDKRHNELIRGENSES